MTGHVTDGTGDVQCRWLLPPPWKGDGGCFVASGVPSLVLVASRHPDCRRRVTPSTSPQFRSFYRPPASGAVSNRPSYRYDYRQRRA